MNSGGRLRVGEAALARVKAQCSRWTAIAEGRYAFELPPEARPQEVMTALVASGASVVSLNPLRETLEDFFMRQVAAQPSVRRADL